jgi:hypothetical protein
MGLSYAVFQGLETEVAGVAKDIVLLIALNASRAKAHPRPVDPNIAELIDSGVL